MERFGDMTEMIRAYEQRANAESKFVYALDKVMPMILGFINHGYTWQKQNISLGELRNIKDSKVQLSDEIYPYFKELVDILTNRPDLIKP